MHRQGARGWEPLRLGAAFCVPESALLFPGGSAVKNSPANARGTGVIPGLGRSLEKEMATLSSILAWKTAGTEKAIVHGVTNSQTRVSN